MELLELPPVHRVKQHRHRGHLGQRHRALPVVPRLVAAFVEHTVLQDRLELLAKLVDRAEQLPTAYS